MLVGRTARRVSNQRCRVRARQQAVSVVMTDVCKPSGSQCARSITKEATIRRGCAFPWVLPRVQADLWGSCQPELQRMSVGPCMPHVRSENSSFLPQKSAETVKAREAGLPVLKIWRSCNDNGDIHGVCSAMLRDIRTLVNGGASTASKAKCAEIRMSRIINALQMRVVIEPMSANGCNGISGCITSLTEHASQRELDFFLAATKVCCGDAQALRHWLMGTQFHW